MRKRTSRRIGIAALLSIVAVAASFRAPAPALAAEPAAAAPGPVASTWILWPKAGSGPALEEGMRAHAAWRKSAGEGWSWQIYQPVVGEDLVHYVVRSEGHPWGDLDANEAWGQANDVFAKYMEQVGQHVARVEHYLGLADDQHSKWEMSDDYRYFGVTSFELRPGAYGEMLQALDKVHRAAVEKKWPRSYAIEWTVGGDGEMVFVAPFRSYAEMAEPDPPFIQMLAEALGSMDAAAATMKQLTGSFASESYTVYRYRPDLSTPK